jgi:hypothetical protein
MKSLTEQMRGLARVLRVKNAAEQASPKPIPNPVASRAGGDMGSAYPPVPKTKGIGTPNPFQMLKGLGSDALAMGDTDTGSSIRV